MCNYYYFDFIWSYWKLFVKETTGINKQKNNIWYLSIEQLYLYLNISVFFCIYVNLQFFSLLQLMVKFINRFLFVLTDLKLYEEEDEKSIPILLIHKIKLIVFRYGDNCVEVTLVKTDHWKSFNRNTYIEWLIVELHAVMITKNMWWLVTILKHNWLWLNIKIALWHDNS